MFALILYILVFAAIDLQGCYSHAPVVVVDSATIWLCNRFIHAHKSLFATCFYQAILLASSDQTTWEWFLRAQTKMYAHNVEKKCCMWQSNCSSAVWFSAQKNHGAHLFHAWLSCCGKLSSLSMSVVLVWGGCSADLRAYWSLSCCNILRQMLLQMVLAWQSLPGIACHSLPTNGYPALVAKLVVLTLWKGIHDEGP